MTTDIQNQIMSKNLELEKLMEEEQKLADQIRWKQEKIEALERSVGEIASETREGK